MDKHVYNGAALKQYLLGEISEEERDRIERQYLADKDFLDELLSVEDDLVDEYALGELSSNEREQFERRLLATPAQREKVRQAQLLSKAFCRRRFNAAQTEKAKASGLSSWFSGFPSFASAFALLLLFISTTWLFIRERQLSAKLQGMQTERTQIVQHEQDLQTKLQDEQREKSELLQQLQNIPQTEPPQESTSTPTVATFVLPLTLTRGSEGTSFTLKHGVDILQLRAPLTFGEYESYQAEFQSADGASIYSVTRLKARKTTKGNTLLLRIPAKLLKGSDYVLRITGVAGDGHLEGVGFYSFRIIRN
jgi:hypothetical protein